jgi:transcriptional regulator of heat shock response
LQSALATDQPLKQLVKLLSVEIHGCVGFAQGSQDFYYTGLSELFAQPEFRDQQYLLDVSRLIDTFDGILAALPRQSVKRSAVLLGEENSLPVACALFVAPWEYQGESGVFACLTPLRADYNYILGLLDSVIDTLDSHS